MEVMVVIIIIGITLLIWKFASSGHVKLAIVNEGRTFIEKVVAQEKMYRAGKGNGSFKTISTATKVDNDIMINTYDNKYFLTFKVTGVSASGFTAVVVGSGKANGINVTGVYTAANNNLAITETGL